MTEVGLPGTPTTTPLRETRMARTERIRLLLRSPTVVIGSLVLAFWVFCALFPGLVDAARPDLRQPVPDEPASPSGDMRSARTRTDATSSPGSSPGPAASS